MKWGRKYGPHYVNKLYAMVRRHLSGDFDFVCLTDDTNDIRSEVRCLPIPPLDLPAGIPERGWTKLATFASDLHGLRGTALFLDLDVVVVGSLDTRLDQPLLMMVRQGFFPWWDFAFVAAGGLFAYAAEGNLITVFSSQNSFYLIAEDLGEIFCYIALVLFQANVLNALKYPKT